MPRVRADNDARYALRASFVDETGAVISGDTITINSSPEDPRITSTQISNWDTAYGWGNHASAGYAVASSLNTANWDTAYGWGDHGAAGYYVNSTAGNLFTNRITFTNKEATDVAADGHFVFDVNDSSAGATLGTYGGSYPSGWYFYSGGNTGRFWTDEHFSGTHVANWQTAYGWGNHASAGYLTFSGTTANTYTTTADWNANFIGTSSGMSFRKTSWSYAGNANLTDAGNLTETAGLSTIRWSDGSRNTVLCIAPTTGGSANRVMVYNDQGSGYSPGWREIHTDKNNCVAPSYNVGSCQWQGVTGNYGSMQIDGGATGGWEGYNIGGRAVFMHNNSTSTGIYNDVNNHWLFYAVHGDASYMYHNGASKIYTYSSGGRVTGNLLATSDVYAYYSDRRLKDVVGRIESPLESIGAIETFYYTHNDKARELGYEGSERQVGVSAQSVQAVLPEVIGRAPIDDDGEGGSVTGEDYMTVKYDRIVPLLIEGIKELQARVEELENGSN